MSRIYSDPTANTAIANVMRSQREKERCEAKRASAGAEKAAPRGREFHPQRRQHTAASR